MIYKLLPKIQSALYLIFFCTFFLSSCTALNLQPTEKSLVNKSSLTTNSNRSLENHETVTGPATVSSGSSNSSIKLQPLTIKETSIVESKEADPFDARRTGRSSKVRSSQSRAKPLKASIPNAAAVAEDMSSDSASLPVFNSESLVINMEDAELYDVILFFIKQLDLNCIIEPSISGKITIRTAGKLNTADLFPLFFQILEANGLTAIKEGKFYRIVNMANAPRTNIGFSQNVDQDGHSLGMLLQIIPLKFINADEMVKILTPFISEQGSLISHADTKNLLLVDTSRNIEKILRLVRSFDVDKLASIGHRFFHIEYVDSQRIGQTLSEILPLYDAEDRKIKIINLEKLNSLLVLSDNETIFGKIEELLLELDQPVNDVESHIYIYFLKNSQADNMASLLNSIFSQGKQQIESNKDEIKDEKKGSEQNPFAVDKQDSKEKPVVKVTRQTSLSDFGTGALRGEINITEDTIRNALIIDALPSDYKIVERVLKRLDILPRQVLISVTIASIDLTDALDLGVDWEFHHLENGSRDSNFFYDIVASGATGFNLNLGEGINWSATLNALATKNLANIVASPSVLASDNVTAKIDITSEIPIASAQITYDDSNNNKTQTDIQYRDTGIILNVTPHINENGLVTMDVSQEVSKTGNPVEVGGQSYPAFFKKSVVTKLTVNSGQTIAIGGLISEDKSDVTNGIPILKDLPLLGWIFGIKSEEIVKSEMIILITPRVISTPDDIDAVTTEFTNKLSFEVKL